MKSPTPSEIKAARALANKTQSEAAAVIHTTMPTWQQWEYDGKEESRKRRMHPAFFELFLIKTGQLPVVIEVPDQDVKKTKPRLIFGISRAAFNRMMKKVESMPQSNAHEIKQYARTRFLLVLMFYTNLSLAKIAKLTMSEVALSSEFSSGNIQNEFLSYRKSLELPEKVSANDETPVIIKFGNDAQPMSRAGLHLIIKPILE